MGRQFNLLSCRSGYRLHVVTLPVLASLTEKVKAASIALLIRELWVGSWRRYLSSKGSEYFPRSQVDFRIEQAPFHDLFRAGFSSLWVIFCCHFEARLWLCLMPRVWRSSAGSRGWRCGFSLCLRLVNLEVLCFQFHVGCWNGSMMVNEVEVRYQLWTE